MSVDLRFDKVTYRYQGRAALTDVSFAIEAGASVALVGANGAGKTTLLQLCASLLFPSSGLVEVVGVRGEPRNAKQIRSSVALVFADPDDQLFCPTVLDEVAFAPRQRGETEARSQKRARDELARVGLSALETRSPLTLSLGEKKRLAIASSLAADARVLLLDEPTSGLDPRARKQFLALLATLPGTVLFATHDLDAALDLNARVLVLRDGCLTADGAASTLLLDEPLLQRNGLELPLSVGPRRDL